ncbi:helix-turn-helix domain-containing protein [Amycolatopsis sp. FBCC-B4732]|uniref:helix-turn-helix domain-containing protein n=1 Tax=Amycolatopsis sp. FBCC-B4732 TaxID=3079339 RepID=UPI001FF6CBB5|nr:helix-turn-helix domain-containing protein [Amycolatopsis sp. FBCC-B4732]UOX87836.1 helix-turn-helix domain-containing protein [Amycolatopsis sp. FBCC-B4732]
MSRSWKDVKADKAAIDRDAGRDVGGARAAAREATEAFVLGFRLAQLREDAGLSQTELAKRMGVSQPRISQLEQGDPGQMELDTLRRYISALGGRLRVVADFDDHDVTVSAPAPEAAPEAGACA